MRIAKAGGEPSKKRSVMGETEITNSFLIGLGPNCPAFFNSGDKGLEGKKRTGKRLYAPCIVDVH